MTNNMHVTPQSARPQAGFSLIELLVGAAIAMIIFLVISFVFANFENQKRITTIASDTQSSGSMAIVEMEQAIRSAGAGIISDEAFDCTNTYSYFKKASSATAQWNVPGYGQNFAPVVITNGGGGTSDTIELRAGSAVEGSAPTELAQPITIASTEMVVKRGTGFPVDKVLMVVDGTNCVVMQVSSIPDSTTPNRLSIAPGSGDTWNPTPSDKTSHSWPSLLNTKASVYAPGALAFRTYSINANNQLQVLNQVANATASTDVLVGDVVDLQAQYGVSSAVGNQDVANWVEPTGVWAAAALDADHVKRIKAIRFVIVVRNPKLESKNVTSSCVNNAGTNNGPCAWADNATDPAPLINLSGNPDWQKYRYRVFQTVVPLRNLIWAGV